MVRHVPKLFDEFIQQVPEQQQREFSIMVLVAINYDMRSDKSSAWRLQKVRTRVTNLACVCRLVSLLRKDYSARALFERHDRALLAEHPWVDPVILVWLQLVHCFGGLNLTDGTLPAFSIRLGDYCFKIKISPVLTPEIVDIITSFEPEVREATGVSVTQRQVVPRQAHQSTSEPSSVSDACEVRPAKIMRILFEKAGLLINCRGGNKYKPSLLLTEPNEFIFFVLFNTATDDEWKDVRLTFGQPFIDDLCAKYAIVLKAPRGCLRSRPRVPDSCPLEVPKAFLSPAKVSALFGTGDGPVPGEPHCPRVVEFLRQKCTPVSDESMRGVSPEPPTPIDSEVAPSALVLYRPIEYYLVSSHTPLAMEDTPQPDVVKPAMSHSAPPAPSQPELAQVDLPPPSLPHAAPHMSSELDIVEPALPDPAMPDPALPDSSSPAPSRPPPDSPHAAQDMLSELGLVEPALPDPTPRESSWAQIGDKQQSSPPQQDDAEPDMSRPTPLASGKLSLVQSEAKNEITVEQLIAKTASVEPHWKVPVEEQVAKTTSDGPHLVQAEAENKVPVKQQVAKTASGEPHLVQNWAKKKGPVKREAKPKTPAPEHNKKVQERREQIDREKQKRLEDLLLRGKLRHDNAAVNREVADMAQRAAREPVRARQAETIARWRANNNQLAR